MTIEHNSWDVTVRSLSYGDHPNGSATLVFFGEPILKNVHKVTLPGMSQGHTDEQGRNVTDAPSASLIKYAHTLIELAGLMALDGF